MEIDNIYNMDCLEGMKQIPDGTIDADKLIEALTGIYAAEVEDLKRRLTNLESYNKKD